MVTGLVVDAYVNGRLMNKLDDTLIDHSTLQNAPKELSPNKYADAAAAARVRELDAQDAKKAAELAAAQSFSTTLPVTDAMHQAAVVEGQKVSVAEWDAEISAADDDKSIANQIDAAVHGPNGPPEIQDLSGAITREILDGLGSPDRPAPDVETTGSTLSEGIDRDTRTATDDADREATRGYDPPNVGDTLGNIGNETPGPGADDESDAPNETVRDDNSQNPSTPEPPSNDNPG
jgi:hypothetical protein